jgi:hypothetical protein
VWLGKPAHNRLTILASSKMSVNEALQKADNALDTHVGIDEHEVKEIIQSIKEAQYFDASSMAPLTSTSLVSIFHFYLRLTL